MAHSPPPLPLCSLHFCSFPTQFSKPAALQARELEQHSREQTAACCRPPKYHNRFNSSLKNNVEHCQGCSSEALNQVSQDGLRACRGVSEQSRGLRLVQQFMITLLENCISSPSRVRGGTEMNSRQMPSCRTLHCRGVS